jgi:hypothetical protein
MMYRRSLLGVLVTTAVSTVATTVVAVAPASAADTSYYTMRLSPASATVRAGDATKIRISFRAGHRLDHYRVDLSVTGLPAGVTGSFSPARPRLSGTSTLTLTAAPSSPAGAVAATVTVTVTVTVTAMTLSSDPIGTSTGLNLTIG